MNTVKIGEHTYRVGQIAALTQFHITRRLAPALASVGVSIATLKLAAGATVGASMEDFLPALGPVSEVIAKMSDEDTEYIIFKCLAVVQRQQGDKGDAWAAVTVGHQLMFSDIDMVMMLRLTVEAIRFNLGDFLKGLGDGSNSPSP